MGHAQVPLGELIFYPHLRLDTGDGCGQILDGPHSLALSPASGPGFYRVELGAGEREDMGDAENPGRRSRVTAVTRSLALGYFT
jgi:hypothetical protein